MTRIDLINILESIRIDTFFDESEFTEEELNLMLSVLHENYKWLTE